MLCLKQRVDAFPTILVFRKDDTVREREDDAFPNILVFRKDDTVGGQGEQGERERERERGERG